CAVEDTIRVRIVRPPALSLPTDTTACGPLTLTAPDTADDIAYAWLNLDGDTLAEGPAFTTDASGTFVLLARQPPCPIQRDTFAVRISPPLPALDLPDDTAACRTLTLAATDPDPDIAYTWLSLGGDTLADGAGFTATASGTYLLRARRQDCSVEDTIRVRIVRPPALSLPTDTAACGPLALLVPDPSPDIAYTWLSLDGDTLADGASFTTAASGTFVLLARQPPCPTQRDTVRVRIDEPLQLQAQPYQNVLCQPPFRQTYALVPLTGAVYRWHLNGGTTLSRTDSSAITLRWDPDADTRALAVEVSRRACADSLAFQVRLDDPRPRIIALSVSQQQQLRIDYRIDNAQPGRAFRLSADLDEAITQAGSTLLREAPVDLRPVSVGLTLLDDCGEPRTSPTHATVHLSGQIDQDGRVRLRWTPYRGWTPIAYRVDEQAAGAITTTADTSWEGPAAALEVCYTLTAEGASAEQTSRSNRLCLSWRPDVEPPNVFSPNDDGRNERFAVARLGLYPTRQLEVYNRWGRRVFAAERYQGDWTGRGDDGRPLPAGLYYYALRYGATGEAERTAKGWVQIMR
ncbi:MAG: gliding motility-associated C-terminal domain-containing protein, partial [Catalinimonas sp.]